MKKRIVGLDYLRIAAMFGIVMLHVFGAGGILNNQQSALDFYLNDYFEIGFMCSVDVFAILSGYLSINKRRTINRAIELIVLTLFYSFLITTITFCYDKSLIDENYSLLECLFPVFFGRYWYIKCFIPIIILEPIINKALNSLSIETYKRMILISLILFSVIPTLAKNDLFIMNYGYSFSWLLECYCLGGYIRKSEIEIHNKPAGAILCISIPFFLLIYRFVSKKYLGGYHSDFVRYTSPFMVVMAVVLILLFKSLKGEQSSFIQNTSKYTFDVYLIHANIIVFDKIITSGFIWVTKMPTFSQPAIALLCGCAIYCIGTTVGFIRGWIFKKAKISLFINNIANKVTFFDVPED